MTRNLKALGLALVAVFAMSAMTASIASAADVVTTDGNTWLTGTSHDNEFKITGTGTAVRCTTSSYKATVKNNDSSITVTPTYTGLINATPHGEDCTTSIGEAKIDMNGCDYDLTGETTGSDSGTDATVSITCEGSNVIKVTDTSGCTLSIHPQTATSGGVIYTNLPNHTGGAAVKVTATVTGITYSSNFICQLGGIPSEGNDADYTGTVEVTGWNEGGAGGSEGARTAVSVS